MFLCNVCGNTPEILNRNKQNPDYLSLWNLTIEILDLECVLGHVTDVQIENKNALINPPC